MRVSVFLLKYEVEILVMTAHVQSVGLRMTKDTTFYDMSHILAHYCGQHSQSQLLWST